MIEDAKKTLEKLEYKNRTWKSEFYKERSIFDEILMYCCSSDKETVIYWTLVMDLFKEKYKWDID